MDIFIFIKMLIFGFIPMLEEGFDRIRPLGGKTNFLKSNFLQQPSISFILLATVNREGEYAVVTGGNRGIGWHTVKGLIDAGMKVIVGTGSTLTPKLLCLKSTCYRNMLFVTYVILSMLISDQVAGMVLAKIYC